MIDVVAALAEGLCAAGLAQAALGAWAVGRNHVFAGDHGVGHDHAVPADRLPAISVLKPLHGDEQLLEAALESFFLQDHPNVQLVFGAADAADPALAVVERLRRRHPQVPADVVVEATSHGRNGKVGNLINMLPAARHDLLVVADSDMHVPRDHLRLVAATASRPGVGLVTSLYTGLPATSGLVPRLGAAQINLGFLPAAALSAWLGRQDCFGATMAIDRRRLKAIGGFEALADHLADDNVLGRLVRRHGGAIALAPVLPATTVGETRFADLVRHELRWMRTIRALEPVASLGLLLQFPLLWALLAVVFSLASIWSLIGFGVALLVRYAVARRLDRHLGLAGRSLVGDATPLMLLLRDCLTGVVFLASFWSDEVRWRGRALHADAGTPPGASATPARSRSRNAGPQPCRTTH